MYKKMLFSFQSQITSKQQILLVYQNCIKSSTNQRPNAVSKLDLINFMPKFIAFPFRLEFELQTEAKEASLNLSSLVIV